MVSAQCAAGVSAMCGHESECHMLGKFEVAIDRVARQRSRKGGRSPELQIYLTDI
jgi:hypothetical protein